jgi:hypothetical protein
VAEQLEQTARLPAGAAERLAGYGVMGAPCTSGHILAMRRFPVSSVGPGYTSVWHRDPAGRWTIYTDVPALQACPRYFGAELERAVVGEIQIRWEGPRRLAVTIPSGTLQWELTLAPTVATRALNAMGQLLPEALWRSCAVLSMMAALAGPVLRAGHLSLCGRAPNGQWFIVNPRRLWTIAASHATLHGEGLGALGPAPDQGRLGDFWIPQRGLFASGIAFFEPFDPSRHRAIASQAAPQRISKAA